MIRLRREINPAEAYEVASFLRRSVSAKGMGQLPEFPSQPERTGSYTFLPPTTFLNELAFQRVMAEPNVERLVSFFGQVEKLNEAVFDRRTSDVAGAITALREQFGFSLFLLNKVISLKYLFPDDELVQASAQAYLVAYHRPRRDIVAVIFEDCVDPMRSYANMRSTVVGYIAEKRFNPATERILLSHLRVMPQTADDASGALQAHAMFSVVDAQFYLWSRRASLNELAGVRKDHLDRANPPQVAEAIYRSSVAFSTSIFQDAGSDGGAFDEFNILRHSNGWLEYPQVLAHRCAVEQAIGRRLDGVRENSNRAINTAKIPVVEASLRELSEGSYSGQISLEAIDPANGGYLHRVVGLMRILDRGDIVFDYDGERLLALLNKTLDVPALATTSELSSLLSVRRPDKLYQYLRAAVIKDCEETILAEHMLRKATQAVVKERFDNIVQFMEFLYTAGRHVGGHFYATCNEPFLVQLYDLFDTANDVVEARALLLEAYGRLEDDEDANDRAKALRLELKLSRVRDDIDDNRIYIDPVRFHQWLVEKLGNELRAAIPIVAEWSQNITSSADLENPIALMENPELRLGKILDVAYHEFCANKFFGVDSYIGRRIRHGTLKGVMVTEVKSIIDAAALHQRAPDLIHYFKAWVVKYEQAIATIGDEILQLREDGKSRGGLVPSIGASNKIATARLAVQAIADALERDTPVQYAIGTIQEYCWRLLETDLLRIRAEIEKIRGDQLLIDLDSVPSNDGSRPVANDLARKINEAVQRKFATLALWLSQPKNVSPSATILLLFEAVLVEVKEQIPGFEPDVISSDMLSLDLYGHRYHYVYDLLYVLVYNAGLHGQKRGQLSFDVRMEEVGRSVTVSVGSDLRNDQTVETVKTRVREAMDAEIENAFKINKFSGIRKIRALESHLAEFTDFRVAFEGRRVIFSATLMLTAI